MDISKVKEKAFIEDLIELCNKHNLVVVPSYQGEESAHDPMHIVEFDKFWEDYYTRRVYVNRAWNE